LYGIIYIAKVGYDWMPEIGCPRSKHRTTCKRKVKQRTTERGNSYSPEQGDDGRIKMPQLQQTFAISMMLCNPSELVFLFQSKKIGQVLARWRSSLLLKTIIINLNIICATQIILGIQLYIYTNATNIQQSEGI